MKKLIFALIVISAASCAPGKMVGTGYLVTVENGRMMKWDKVETAAQSDSFIWEKTGLTVKTDRLIGTTEPYWDMKSGRQYIYVEKQGIYQRKPDGKKRWRVYDEQLQPETSNVKPETSK